MQLGPEEDWGALRRPLPAPSVDISAHGWTKDPRRAWLAATWGLLLPSCARVGSISLSPASSGKPRSIASPIAAQPWSNVRGSPLLSKPPCGNAGPSRSSQKRLQVLKAGKTNRRRHIFPVCLPATRSPAHRPFGGWHPASDRPLQVARCVPLFLVWHVPALLVRIPCGLASPSTNQGEVYQGGGEHVVGSMLVHNPESMLGPEDRW